jgi:uncharacterized protein
MQYESTNALIHESSPYLLQHAHNPVNWYPWTEAALAKAKAENKLILISIGYSACHWCHVMEHESFEDEATATLMNAHFINIKVDREERPDLDHIYMDALQTLTGSGGWPLNMFLTPDAKPFYGGTYFPPVRAYNRPSWKEVLEAVTLAWRERPSEILAQADSLTDHLQKTGHFQQSAVITTDTTSPFTPGQVHTIFTTLMQTADRDWGGFGAAPKFPQTFVLQYLLQYHHFSENPDALQQALLSLDKMIQGGIYDHVGGGFARYSTDRQWLVPHFEKMLYDNALILQVLCDAYALTRYSRYAQVIRHTLRWLSGEMTHPDGGFYAALDADSEGVEGRFYTWSKAEIEALLGEAAPLFCNYYDISDAGNWEGTNILRILTPASQFCNEKGLTPADFEQKMGHCIQVLLAARNTRVRPQTDDKILLGWNALMLTTLCRCGAVLGEPDLIAQAVRIFDWLWLQFREEDNTAGMRHTFKNRIARYPAFLDDYAYLIQASLHLQETTGNPLYLHRAKALTEYVVDNFLDQDSGCFFFTGKEQKDVIIRKKEVYDGATPSGNSLMTQHLFYLGIVFDIPAWRNQATRHLEGMAALVVKHPGSFGVWAVTVLQQVIGTHEVVVAGADLAAARATILEAFLPNKVLQSALPEAENFPLLTGKTAEGEMRIFHCRQYACAQPMTTVGELLAAIWKADKIILKSGTII